jgi:hypothetical protein
VKVNEPFALIVRVPSVGAIATVKTAPGTTESLAATVEVADEPAVLVKVSSCNSGAGGEGLTAIETLAEADAQVLWFGAGRQTV